MSKQNKIYIAIFAAVLILSFLGWFGLNKFLYGGTNPSGFYLILIAFSFLVEAALLSLFVLFFKSIWYSLFGVLISLCIFLGIYGVKIAYLAGLAAGMAVGAHYLYESIKEKNNRIKLSVHDIAKPMQIGVFTALALIISLIIYFSPPVQGLKAEIVVPRPLFDFVLRATEKIFDTQLPKTLAVPGIGQINVPNPKGIMESANISVEKIITPQVADQVYNSLNQQINFFIKPYRQYLPYGLAIAVFLTLRAINFIFVFISGYFSEAIFGLMKKIKLINIKKEMVEKETIEISI